MWWHWVAFKSRLSICIYLVDFLTLSSALPIGGDNKSKSRWLKLGFRILFGKKRNSIQRNIDIVYETADVLSQNKHLKIHFAIPCHLV